MDWDAAKESLKQKVNSGSDKEIINSISSSSLKAKTDSKVNIGKQPHSQEVSRVGYDYFLGQSIKSIAMTCDVNPKVIIRLLQQKHFEVNNIDIEVTLTQLTAIRSYIETRLSVIERIERTNKRSRSAGLKKDVKSKPRGSVFTISAQIRN